jgi:hypothetical protein
MPRKLAPATRTDGPPRAVGHLCVAAALGLGPNPLAYVLPFRTMSRFQSSDRVGDLVKNAVANGGILIRQHKVNRKLDALIRMAA